MQSPLRFVTMPSRCEYLPAQVSRLEYEMVGQLTSADYLERLHRGWRRMGHALFRPMCPACDACRSLRVPVATFRPNESQRRAWKANRERLTLTVGSPSLSAAKQDLFVKFHRHQQGAKGWPQRTADDLTSFLRNPLPTEEWCYFDGDRLIGLGYVDVVPDGLSAIYFVYDPDARSRSIGTFNVLTVIAAAARLRLPQVYLGYYVEGCRSLEYKARFRPNEVLIRDGSWAPFIA